MICRQLRLRPVASETPVSPHAIATTEPRVYVDVELNAKGVRPLQIAFSAPISLWLSLFNTIPMSVGSASRHRPTLPVRLRTVHLRARKVCECLCVRTQSVAERTGQGRSPPVFPSPPLVCGRMCPSEMASLSRRLKVSRCGGCQREIGMSKGFDDRTSTCRKTLSALQLS